PSRLPSRVMHPGTSVLSEPETETARPRGSARPCTFDSAAGHSRKRGLLELQILECWARTLESFRKMIVRAEPFSRCPWKVFGPFPETGRQYANPVANIHNGRD